MFHDYYTDRFPAELASIIKYVQLMRTMAFSSRYTIFLAYKKYFLGNTNMHSSPVAATTQILIVLQNKCRMQSQTYQRQLS